MVRSGGRGGKSSSGFSLVFSEDLSGSSEVMKKVEGLFIENGWVKGSNSSTFALIMAFLKTSVNNCSEKMESLNRI